MLQSKPVLCVQQCKNFVCPRTFQVDAFFYSQERKRWREKYSMNCFCCVHCFVLYSILYGNSEVHSSFLYAKEMQSKHLSKQSSHWLCNWLLQAFLLASMNYCAAICAQSQWKLFHLFIKKATYVCLTIFSIVGKLDRPYQCSQKYHLDGVCIIIALLNLSYKVHVSAWSKAALIALFRGM